MDRDLDVQTFLDERRFSPFQWLILVMCFLIVAVDGLDTAAMGFVAPSLIAEWGVTKLQLAPVMGAALLGLAVGSLTAGPLADHYGRKPVIVISVLVFGLAGICCSQAWSLWSLTVLRFVTGIGLGAAMPNTVTLMTEYTPTKQRNRLSTLMFCGFSLGSAAAALVAALVIPQFGWRALLLIGGVLPVILAILTIFLVPESPRFLVVKGASRARIATIMKKISPRQSFEDVRFSIAEVAHGGGAPVGELFRNNNAFGTLMLWLTYFMGLLIAYLFTGWMPILMKEMGTDLAHASIVTGLFMLGSTFGTVFMGWLMDKFSRHMVVANAYAASGVALFCLGTQAGNIDLIELLVFVTGFAMGANLSMVVLSAQFYDTRCRATGVSWMLGIGRFGGILGASVGGALMSAGWDFMMIIGGLAVPAFIAAFAIFLKGRYYARRPGEPEDTSSGTIDIAVH